MSQGVVQQFNTRFGKVEKLFIYYLVTKKVFVIYLVVLKINNLILGVLPQTINVGVNKFPLMSVASRLYPQGHYSFNRNIVIFALGRHAQFCISTCRHAQNYSAPADMLRVIQHLQTCSVMYQHLQTCLEIWSTCRHAKLFISTCRHAQNHRAPLLQTCLRLFGQERH